MAWIDVVSGCEWNDNVNSLNVMERHCKLTVVVSRKEYQHISDKWSISGSRRSCDVEGLPSEAVP